MNHVIRFLFGHEQAVFTNGRFGFDLRPGIIALILILAALAAVIYFVYFHPRNRTNKRTTAILVGLRAAILTLMIVLLLRPVVVVSSVVPRSTNVAVVLDDSLSMKLRDTPGGATRLDGVRQALFSAPSGQRTFMNLLDERFKTELYGFSG